MGGKEGKLFEENRVRHWQTEWEVVGDSVNRQVHSMHEQGSI